MTQTSDTIDTLEMRWFKQGALPRHVLAWFKDALKGVRAEPERTDTYLWLPGSYEVGIKHREGRLEIKQRTACSTSVKVGASFGEVESWCKIMLEWPGKKAAAHAEKLFESLPEMKVTKRRHLVMDKNDCQIELTGLEALDSAYWTLGFEIVGDGLDAQENLLKAANGVLDGDGAPVFGIHNAMGYPAWLASKAWR